MPFKGTRHLVVIVVIVSDRGHARHDDGGGSPGGDRGGGRRGDRLADRGPHCGGEGRHGSHHHGDRPGQVLGPAALC